MKRKLKILILIKPFWRTLAKHKSKFDMIKAFEEFADVMYWYKDENIVDILKYMLKKHNFKPDFILHYDNSHTSFSPKISGLSDINIPKGLIIVDIYWPVNKKIKAQFIIKNKIDLVFSATKEAFLNVFPEFKEKFRWLPFSINPNIYKDRNLNKDIDYLLMGLIDFPSKGTYPFREVVLKEMKKEKGFVHHAHPGHLIGYAENSIVNEKYALELNRSKIFFTCGSKYHYPVLKYFEAPACKTLLLAEPNKDILELGFEDNVNFISCNKTDLYEKAKYYIKNDNIREKISINGYKFIHTYHTNRVRALQFIEFVEKYLKG
ncbi:glycosyltransferase family protein [Priestia megaterium]|uniref:glycosyltransferase family protein n=1 Tax=Priestia megaterium TaxID=1404 RepID=UPI00398FF42A